MAIWASNPVTLNRQQLLQSLRRGVVVRARVVDADAGRCEAIEQWPAPKVADSFQVASLERTEARTGETYLLPLLPTDDGYAVTPSPGGQLLIYPDTAEALSQLNKLLALP